MRPRQFWIYTSIYLAVLLMIFLINYSGYKNEVMYKTLTGLHKSLFFQFLVLQILVMWVWASFNSSSAVREEVTDKTYDFFRMLPIPARSKMVGILVGKNLVALLLAALNFILLIGFGLAGKLSANLLAQVVLLLISVALLANSVALLSSVNPKGKKSKSGIVGFILLAFFLGPAIINGVIEFAEAKDIELVKAKFFTLELPVLILISLVVLYFWCWSIKGILRKFTREDEPMFTRTGAYLFMLGYQFVLFGLFYYYLLHPKSGAFTINLAFWLTSLYAIVSIPLGSKRSFNRYLEFSGLYLSSSGSKLRLPRLFLYSNLSLGLGLFAIWAIVAMTTTSLAGLDFVEHLDVIAVFLSFYLFLLLLLEVHVVASPYASKLGVLLIFIVGVYAVFPLIVAGIFDIDEVAWHSPFGYVFYLFDQSQRQLQTTVRIAVVNLLLSAVPAAIILRRYVDVIKARRKM